MCQDCCGARDRATVPAECPCVIAWHEGDPPICEIRYLDGRGHSWVLTEKAADLVKTGAAEYVDEV